MTDQTNPGAFGAGSFDPGSFDAGQVDPTVVPPLPPLAPPPGSFAPTEVFDLAAPVPVGAGPSRPPGRFAVLGLGALMVGGGTVFALTSAGGGGPETPEEAAAALFDAIGNEDALGVLGALDPAERDAVREPLQQMVGELERLEVLDESFALDDIAGFDFEFDGLVFEVEQVRPDLARVHIAAGEASIAVDGDQVAVGGFVDDVVDRFDADMGDLSMADTSAIDSNDSGGFLVARDTAEGWRISLGYTAAEAARDVVGAPVPAAGDGITAVGADSPEQAVDDMVRSIAAMDFDGVIARMSSEMQPLREYSALYEESLADAERVATDEARFEINDLRLEADTNGSTARVFVRGFDITVEADGSRFDVMVDGNCVTIEGDIEDLGLEDSPFESGQVCLDDLDELSQDGLGLGDLEDEFADEGIEIPAFPPLNDVQFGIVAVRENGQWFVSPVRTMLDAGVNGLRAINREHLDAMVDMASSVVDSFEGGSFFGEEITTFDEFDDEFTTTDEFDPGASAAPDPDFDPNIDPDFAPDGRFDGEFDFEFPQTFEEQMEFLFDDDAACIIAEVNLLPPDLQKQVRANIGTGGLPSAGSSQTLGRILETCLGLDS